MVRQKGSAGMRRFDWLGGVVIILACCCFYVGITRLKRSEEMKEREIAVAVEHFYGIVVENLAIFEMKEREIAVDVEQIKDSLRVSEQEFYKRQKLESAKIDSIRLYVANRKD
jgi:hypothetical protein